MLYGAASAGVRAMTASSGPGISLMQEGISYMAGAELPCVIADITRGGPGLGNIAAEQSDYHQVVKGGGHGSYRTIVLAPHSVQEMADLTALAFELADRYRNPVVILADGFIGQMMEPVEFPQVATAPRLPEWAVAGTAESRGNLITSLHLECDELEKHIRALEAKYKVAEQHEARAEEWFAEDAEIVLVGYGIVGRILKAVTTEARADGLKVGLLRPITLYPFPTAQFQRLAARRARLCSCGDEQRPNAGGRKAGARTARGRSSSSIAWAATCRRTKRCSNLCANRRGASGCRGELSKRSGWQMSSEPITEYTVSHGKAKAFYERYERKEEMQHQTHFCPGCGHGQVHKMLAKAIDDLGVQDRTILVGPVGCGVFTYYYFDVGNVSGRARTRAGRGHGHETQPPRKHRHQLPGRRRSRGHRIGGNSAHRQSRRKHHRDLHQQRRLQHDRRTVAPTTLLGQKTQPRRRPHMPPRKATRCTSASC